MAKTNSIDWSRIPNGERSYTQKEFLAGSTGRLFYRNRRQIDNLDLPFEVEPFLRDPIGFINEQIKQPHTSPKRPSFAGCNLATETLGELVRDNTFIGLRTMLEQALKKAPGCLHGADFESSVLIGINFTKADLRKANFRRSSLAGQYEKANFSGADLRGADFKYSDLKNATITGAIIDHTTVLPYGFGFDKFLENGGKIQIDWSRVLKTRSEEQKACDYEKTIQPTEDIQEFFQDPIAYVMQHKTRPSLDHIDLKGIDLREIAQRTPGVFEGMNFIGADLSGQDLSWMNLKSASLAGANLEGTNTLGTNFYGADVGGAIAAPWQIMFARGVSENSRCEQLVTTREVKIRGAFGQIHDIREDDWKMMNLSYVLEALNPFKGR